MIVPLDEAAFSSPSSLLGVMLLKPLSLRPRRLLVDAIGVSTIIPVSEAAFSSPSSLLGVMLLEPLSLCPRQLLLDAIGVVNVISDAPPCGVAKHIGVVAPCLFPFLVGVFIIIFVDILFR